jgi:hypothetical protein
MKRFIRSSSSQESALQESHEARRFYTARVKSGGDDRDDAAVCVPLRPESGQIERPLAKSAMP